MVKSRRMCAKSWDLWKSPQSRSYLQRNGYTLYNAPDGNRYLCKVERLMSKQQEEMLIQESRAADTESELLRPPGKEYYPFQRAGIKYCTDRLFAQNGQAGQSAVLIGDGMGLGKTIQAIGILNQDPDLRQLNVLVVCPASLKLNWKREMQTFLLDGLGQNVEIVKKRWPGGLIEPKIVVTNYDVLHRDAREIWRRKWDYLIFDEAHYLKNEKTRWTIFAMGGMMQSQLIPPIDAKYTVFITGTPIPNKVEEAWPIIKRCDPDGLGANWDAFRTRYCKSKENLLELQKRMRTRFMVRRLKEEVFKDFPEKIRKVWTIDPSECKGIDTGLFQKEMSIFREYQELLQQWALKIELAKADGAAEYLKQVKAKRERLGMKASELAKLRMKTAIAKAPAVAERVAYLSESGENKIVVFGYHHEVMDLLKEKLTKAGLRCCILDGRVNANNGDRQKMVDAFQAGELDVFIGGIKPAGTGWTLTRGTICMFAELDYVPGNLTQCEDREHRIGQENAVYVEHDVLEGSLDEFMAGILVDKQDTIGRAMDWDEEEDVEEEETADGMMQKERASTHGVSGKKIAEEAMRMKPRMVAQATKAASILREHLDVSQIDKQILEGLAGKAATPYRAALYRRFAMRYKHLVGELAEGLQLQKANA